MTGVAAHESVRGLLECLGITRVISVDDRHAPDDVVLINLGRKLTGEERAQVLDMPGEAETLAENDFFENNARERFEGFNAPERAAAIQRLQALSHQSEIADDTAAFSVLKGLVPDDLYAPMSLDQWRDAEEEVLSGDVPTLVLFDRDFSAEGESEDAGIALMLEVQKKTAGDRVWTGLLTHRVSRGDEFDSYKRLVADGADPHRSIVISKANLTEGTLPVHLRLTLLAPLLRALVNVVADKIDDSHATALERLRDVTPYELESMVFGASSVESVPETDTLLLLFELLQRGEVRRTVQIDERIGDLTSKVRRLNAVDLGGPVADPAPEAEEGKTTTAPATGETPTFFQRLQIYDDVDHVNSLHLPLDNGDIFSPANKPSKFWVVVGPPCELMVRANGYRGDNPVEHVAIAPLSRKPSPSGTDFRLPYFDDRGRDYFVKIPLAKFVRVSLLDLAVFSADGLAELDLGADPPPGLVDGWRSRHTVLTTSFSESVRVAQRLKRVVDAAPAVTDDDGAEIDAAELLDTTTALLIGDSTGSPFTPSIALEGEGVISAGTHRTGRLATEYATALLARFTAHFGRPVLPYDLTRAG